MKLVQHIDDGSGTTDDYRTRPDANQNKDDLYSASILVKRLGLYIMSHSSRYNFTHEILKNEESIFKGQKIHKTRRISVICRDEPE
jgi:alkylated DNA repair protein alkB family protein 7